MIVLINDESHLSDWCTFEWETARELEVPIRVVVDLERGNKAECLAHAASFPGLEHSTDMLALVVHQCA